MHFSMLRKANIGMVFIMQHSFGGGGIVKPSKTNYSDTLHSFQRWGCG